MMAEPAHPPPDMSEGQNGKISGDKPPIILDSNVVLFAMIKDAENGADLLAWCRENQERLMMLPGVIKEVKKILKEEAEAFEDGRIESRKYEEERFPWYDEPYTGVLPDGRSYYEKIDAEQQKMLNSPDSPKAREWVRLKRWHLKKWRKVTDGQIHRALDSHDTGSISLWLEDIYYYAKADREITAVACAVAEQRGEAHLVSSDADVHILHDFTVDMTGGRLKIFRPRDLRKTGV